MSRDTLPSERQAAELRDRLDAARTLGGWMAWAGLAAALIWWGGASGGVFGLIGWESLAAQPAALVVAVGVFIFLPGLLMGMGGVMARQSARATAANELVLQASSRLLAPAETARDELARVADTARQSTELVNRTLAETLAAMAKASAGLENERLRAESVSYAMADNARELTRRLTEERIALEQLAKSLDQQTRLMTDAIPRQAGAMAEAAKKAGEDIAEADLALEKRLHQMKHAGSTLAVRLGDLETVARDAMIRAEALGASVTRIEDKLNQSQKTVEMAERASAMAVESANAVGRALQDAVSAALDSAREANAEITKSTRALREETGRTAVAPRMSPPVTNGAKPPASAQAPRPAPASAPMNGSANGHAAANGRGPSLPLQPAPHRDNPLPPPSAQTAGDEDLFEPDTTRDVPAIVREPAVRPASEPARAPARAGSSEWRDIIADIEDEQGPGREPAALPREATAEQLIARLQDSGIALPTAFRPKDKKRIAAAARKDEGSRRSAIREAAGSEVDRVATRLRKDDALLRLAQRFVIAEEDDALKALAETSRSGRPASPRLSAYLLVDAALEAAARA